MRTAMYPTIFMIGLAALAHVRASADTIPMTSLSAYEVFRADLQRSGWIPDYNYGAKLDDGSPMFRYPEVVCGNKTCSAQWIGKIDRNRIVFVLWRGSKGNLLVAPQVEFPD